MTQLVLNSGLTVDITLPIEEFADLLEDALVQGSLVEVAAPDGRKLIINPHQVAMAQGMTTEGAVTRRLAPARAAG